MTQPAFIHLRLHSEFSIVDGMVRLPQAVARAVEEQMPALALTDLMNLFGMVKFYKSCQAKGVQPIIGVDLWLQNEQDRDAPFRLLLLAKNRAGYGSLCRLLSRAYRENRYRGRAECRREWLTVENCADLIALSGAAHGDIGQALLKGNTHLAQAYAREWARIFPKAFYLEVQRIGDKTSEMVTEASLVLASELDLPLVATHPIQFMAADDFKAHEARVCIAEGETLGNPKRLKKFTEAQYFKSSSEMRQLFSDIPQALQNSVEIAKRCCVEIQLGKNFLPDFPTPQGMSLDDFLWQEAQNGLEKRLRLMFPDPDDFAQKLPDYLERLKFETQTITQMGFPGYFLIVADFINWAKQNGVPVGPGRGSGAGSLVAFALGITDIDPTAYALLFERFLNPERVSMPDFDIDFCQDKRGLVIQYVRERYGSDAVSQIITFGSLASKAVVRDVGRVLDLPYSLCDGLSKLIPSAPGKQYSLDDAVEMEPTLKERIDNEEEVAELWSLAKKLEGLTRNVGMHAGGVLIAPTQLTDFCPIYLAPGEDAVAVSQFDKDDVEQVGLVKFDFLGLRNLTIIDLASKYIQKTQPDFEINQACQGFDDAATYQVLQKANTTAVFQLESDGMKKLLEKLKPDRFEDIIAVLALYRPGPLGSGMVDDFVLRKHGKQEADYFHPDLQGVLEPTYGVIVYQEQVMQISQIIGGYTLGGADMLRRAMGKKKPEEMALHRGKIADGAKVKGYDPALAEMLFDLMAKFAEYGFNKSHTAAYAVVSYQTAWLKAHYPAAFMAATMSSELDNTEQLRVFYEDCQANGLQFCPPDINKSEYLFVPENAQQIRYALGAIKGTGQAAVEHLIAERQKNGDFKDIFDFCMRVDKRIVKRRALDALVRAGAFDSIEPHRASTLANIDLALSLAEQSQNHANQGGLFDIFEENCPPEIERIEVAPWTDTQRLAEEKTAVGYFLSGHPFLSYAEAVRRFVPCPLDQVVPKKELQWIAGMVLSVRTKLGKRGKMAFIQLDDATRKVDVIAYAEVFEQARDKIKEDAVLIFECKVSMDEYTNGLKFVADRVYSLIEAQASKARALRLLVQSPEEVIALAELLPASSSGCALEFCVQTAEVLADFVPSVSWRVLPDDALLGKLRDILGEDRVEILF